MVIMDNNVELELHNEVEFNISAVLKESTDDDEDNVPLDWECAVYMNRKGANEAISLKGAYIITTIIL